MLTCHEHEIRGQELNVVFSCSSIDYLSSDIVTRKVGLEPIKRRIINPRLKLDVMESLFTKGFSLKHFNTLL